MGRAADKPAVPFRVPAPKLSRQRTHRYARRPGDAGHPKRSSPARATRQLFPNRRQGLRMPLARRTAAGGRPHVALGDGWALVTAAPTRIMRRS
jgi:hypothetical protein